MPLISLIVALDTEQSFQQFSYVLSTAQLECCSSEFVRVLFVSQILGSSMHILYILSWSICGCYNNLRQRINSWKRLSVKRLQISGFYRCRSSIGMHFISELLFLKICPNIKFNLRWRRQARGIKTFQIPKNITGNWTKWQHFLTLKEN